MLTITELSKTYSNGVKALNGLNLTVKQGMFGLLGPNGAGKSSLMRTLATLQSPDSGKIIFNGSNILNHPQSMRNNLGYLPQEFGVYPNILPSPIMAISRHKLLISSTIWVDNITIVVSLISASKL